MKPPIDPTNTEKYIVGNIVRIVLGQYADRVGRVSEVRHRHDGVPMYIIDICPMLWYYEYHLNDWKEMSYETTYRSI